MHIIGFIFDFDGLILDTETAEYQSWKELFNTHHLDLPFTDWSLAIGTSNKVFDVYACFEKQIGKTNHLDQIYRRREERYHKLVGSLSPFPGILDLLIEAHSIGIKVALASSSTQDWVVPHLERLGMLPFFDSIHTQEEVEEVKPCPDLYLHAVKALGMQAKEAVAFEDSPNGIRAAKDAGVYCVAIPNPITSVLDLGQADIILPSLKNMTVSKINGMLEKIPVVTELP